MTFPMKFFNTRPSPCLECKRFGTSYSRKDRLGRGYFCSQDCFMAYKSHHHRPSWPASDTSESDASDISVDDSKRPTDASSVDFANDKTTTSSSPYSPFVLGDGFFV
ncbi:hypothetical protein Ae201684P_009549 [Aphanomyces euteiches]|uniref:Uncharacterized protein n=1 Tax=Aphanomyces euteiches TaxID=100861 RepID=A0A6G0WL57_9STRA|nr:hypothetical protein Ae201684_014117 [Aphanomyces euteiches]KAH9096317.1 hypothetical protein Ae201684P_009549 [Aphanomyces euteiches]